MNNPTIKQKHWNGSGFPPVGIECEIYPYFHKCKIVTAYMSGVLVHDYHDNTFFHLAYGQGRFRPIKTQAEIDREELKKIFIANRLSDADTAVAEIISAGYRKQNDDH